jgi:hypothetical protein
MKRALVLLVLLLAVACKKTKTNDLPEEAWGADDYAAVGLRSDQPWTGADYTRAASVLGEQTKGHRERLPRYQGAKSGALFARLIEPLPPDADKPIGERFVAHMERYHAANAISKLYVENALAVPTREWVELTGVLMREGSALAGMAEELIASFGPDDPKREVRLDGLAKMRRGFGELILGSLLTAGDTRVPEVDRIAAVGHVNTAMPALIPFAEPGTKTQIREQVKRLVDGLPGGKLKQEVRKTQATIEAASP